MNNVSPIAALIGSFVPLLLLIAHGIGYGILCKRLANHKGYTGYFWTGFFLTLVGLIYVAALPVDFVDESEV